MLQTEQVLQQRYQLAKQLGNNAGRQTWLARDLNFFPAEPVIVKLLAFSPQMQWEEFKLFEREASVLKQLNHPRIPKYRDYFSVDKQTGEGLCWFGLVQNYIPGQSLQQLLESGERFTETQVRLIATQVLEILIYLHGLNHPLLHRDIKPSNLLIGQDQQVYLVDFGAVQNSAAVEGVTFTVVGTTGYAPLEQFWGQAVAASDLYALGATLIHLLTGIAPANLPQRNLRIQFKDQVSINPHLVSWIEAITEPDLNLRLNTASQALEALQTGRSISYPLQTIRPPCQTRIEFKKSPTHLSIKIPGRGLLIILDILIFLGKTILLLSLGISLLGTGCLTVLLGFVLLGTLVMLIQYPVIMLWWILGFVALFVLGRLFRFGDKEFGKIGSDLRQTQFLALGDYYIEVDRTKFLIKNWLFCESGKTSNLLELFRSPNSQNSLFKNAIERQRVYKNFSNSERQWLIQEIQEWLADG
ncbi:MAG TPA: serine/threonine protein kinase [Cyanobacteria bacterium UBA8803]|nr:serine/threonine protein kinase [Cyanobacteria bacterium UBA9273]HBL59463.1 serine/threonine protein kinase [Cyanobacteria bacterium UBA8803]